MRGLLALLLCLVAPVHASPEEEVVLGLSQQEVSITTNFSGSEILIFGAIRRDAPAPETDLEIAITVAGPSEPVKVRKKARRYGIWVNVEEVEVDAAPSFYAVASSGPLKEILSEVEDLRHKISIPLAIRSVGAPMDIDNPQRFTDAVIRIREGEAAYLTRADSVEITRDALFQTSIQLPANLTEGDYVTRVFLIRDREVVSVLETVIDVSKVGLERWLYTLAQERPLAYGLLSLFVAIAAGWGASAAFRLFRAE